MKPSQIFWEVNVRICCFCHSVPCYFKNNTCWSHQTLCFPAVATVFKPYLFYIPIQCHSFQPLKVFSFLPWSYSRSFSFLSLYGIFVFTTGLEHGCLRASASAPSLQAVLRKLFPIHSSPLLFVIFLYSGGQFGYIFSFLCC